MSGPILGSIVQHPVLSGGITEDNINDILARPGVGEVEFITEHRDVTEEDFGKIFLDVHGNAYAVDSHAHPTVPPTAVFTDVTIDTEFSGTDGQTRAWKGVRSSSPNVLTTEAVHSFYYRTSSGHHGFFEQVIAQGPLGIPLNQWIAVDGNVALGANARFYGEFTSEQEALDSSPLEVNGYIIVGHTLKRVSAYSAGTLEVPTTYSLRRIGQVSAEYLAGLLNTRGLLTADALADGVLSTNTGGGGGGGSVSLGESVFANSIPATITPDNTLVEGSTAGAITATVEPSLDPDGDSFVRVLIKVNVREWRVQPSPQFSDVTYTLTLNSGTPADLTTKAVVSTTGSYSDAVVEDVAVAVLYDAETNTITFSIPQASPNTIADPTGSYSGLPTFTPVSTGSVGHWRPNVVSGVPRIRFVGGYATSVIDTSTGARELNIRIPQSQSIYSDNTHPNNGDTYILWVPDYTAGDLRFSGFQIGSGIVWPLHRMDGEPFGLDELSVAQPLTITYISGWPNGTLHGDGWYANVGAPVEATTTPSGISQDTLEAYIDSVVRNDTHYQLRLSPQAGTPTSTTDGNRATFANLNSAGRFTYHFAAGAQREPVIDVLVENNQPLVLTRLDSGGVRDATRQLTGVARPGEGITFNIPSSWGDIRGFDLTHVEQGAFEVYEVRAYNDIQTELTSLSDRINSESRRANARFIYRSQSATSRPVVPSQFTISSNGLIGWTQPTDSDGNAANWASSSAGLPSSGHVLWSCMLYQDRSGAVRASPPFISSARGPQGITLISFDSDSNQLRAHTPAGDGVTSTFNIDLSSLAGGGTSTGGGTSEITVRMRESIGTDPGIASEPVNDTWIVHNGIVVPPNDEIDDTDTFHLVIGKVDSYSGVHSAPAYNITGSQMKTLSGAVAGNSPNTSQSYIIGHIGYASGNSSIADQDCAISLTADRRLAIWYDTTQSISRLQNLELFHEYNMTVSVGGASGSEAPTGQFQLQPVAEEPETWNTAHGDRALVISGTQYSSAPINEINNGVHAYRYRGATTLYDYPTIDNNRLAFSGGNQAIGFDFGGSRWPDKFIIAFKLYITAFPTAVCDILWGDRPIAPANGGWSFNLDSTGRIHVQFGSSNASRMTTSDGIDLNTEYRIAVGFERNNAGNWELNYNINGQQRTSTTLTRTNDVATEIIVGRSERSGTDSFDGFIYDLVVAETQRDVDHSVTDPFGQADERTAPYGYLSRTELLRTDRPSHGTGYRRAYTGTALTNLQATNASGAFQYDPRDGQGNLPGSIFFRATPTPDTIPEEDISIFIVDGSDTGRLIGSQGTEGHFIPVGSLNSGLLEAYVRNENSTPLTNLLVEVQPYGTQNGDEARQHIWLKNVTSSGWYGSTDSVFGWENGLGDIYLSDLEYLEVSGQAGHDRIPPAIIYPAQIVQRTLTQSRAAMSRKANDLYVQGWTPADSKIGLGTIDDWAIASGVATSVFRFVTGANSPSGTIRYLHAIESHNSVRVVLGVRAVFKPGVQY